MRRNVIRIVLGMFVLGAAYGASLLAQAPAAGPPAASPIATQNVTEKDLLAGLADPTKWLTVSGDYTSQRNSPLTQITPANVGQLAAQWTFQTNVQGKF